MLHLVLGRTAHALVDIECAFVIDRQRCVLVVDGVDDTTTIVAAVARALQ